MSRRASGIELIECDEIVESDHRDFLIDASIADYFAKELFEVYARIRKKLNPSKKVHGEIFDKSLEEMISAIGAKI